MSYTMTFDVSHKVGLGSHATNFFRHIARDVDVAAGFHFPHANQNIDPLRTRLNVTLVNDGAGDFRPLVSVDGRPPSHEFDDYLMTRLATVRRPLRKDAVPIRGVILQLDPKWFEEHNPEWRVSGVNDEAMEHMNAAVDWACLEFGQSNIVGISLHLDEHSPQVQVLVTPVTDDGRLSQKDFFKGPADLRRQHKELREHMEAAGYDVEARVTERSKEHLSSSEFQAKANSLRDAIEDVEAEKATYEVLERSLKTRELNLDLREARLAGREAELAEKRLAANEASAAAQDAQLRAAQAMALAKRMQDEAQAERHQLLTEVDRLRRIPPEIDQWLDRAKFAGRPAREYFEAAVIKVRANRAQVVREATGVVIEKTPADGSSAPEPERSLG